MNKKIYEKVDYLTTLYPNVGTKGHALVNEAVDISGNEDYLPNLDIVGKQLGQMIADKVSYLRFAVVPIISKVAQNCNSAINDVDETIETIKLVEYYVPEFIDSYFQNIVGKRRFKEYPNNHSIELPLVKDSFTVNVGTETQNAMIEKYISDSGYDMTRLNVYLGKLTISNIDYLKLVANGRTVPVNFDDAYFLYVVLLTYFKENRDANPYLDIYINNLELTISRRLEHVSDKIENNVVILANFGDTMIISSKKAISNVIRKGLGIMDDVDFSVDFGILTGLPQDEQRIDSYTKEQLTPLIRPAMDVYMNKASHYTTMERLRRNSLLRSIIINDVSTIANDHHMLEFDFDCAKKALSTYSKVTPENMIYVIEDVLFAGLALDDSFKVIVESMRNHTDANLSIDEATILTLAEMAVDEIVKGLDVVKKK